MGRPIKTKVVSVAFINQGDTGGLSWCLSPWWNRRHFREAESYNIDLLALFFSFLLICVCPASGNPCSSLWGLCSFIKMLINTGGLLWQVEANRWAGMTVTCFATQQEPAKKDPTLFVTNIWGGQKDISDKNWRWRKLAWKRLNNLSPEENFEESRESESSRTFQSKFSEITKSVNQLQCLQL